MENCKYSTAAAFLEDAYDVLNKVIFKSALQKPVITIQTRPKTYGHITLWKAWGNTVEINIAAEWLNRPIEEVAATLVHEMVHQENLMLGIQDVSRSGVYHNRKFRDAAQARWLDVDKMQTYGWAHTTPTPPLEQLVKNQGWSDLDLHRELPPKGAKKPSSTRKYGCPKCGQTIRATREVNLICGDCQRTMLEVE